MEENLTKAGMYSYSDLIDNAMIIARQDGDNSDLQKLYDEGKINIQEYDSTSTQRYEDAINKHYKILLSERYKDLQEIQDANIIRQTGKLIDKGVSKVKSFFEKPKETKVEPLSNVKGAIQKDYHLNKFLMEQNQLMKSKEDYYPPLP